ncbi:hypothetical protein LIER_30475 [Lithospermum erythrorhizon]|uniref:Uncharacterized protein n=1 Tax=Lithospermum erythrorhizon TaxID=34254 RepID=A0AAV3RQ05_LITER
MRIIEKKKEEFFAKQGKSEYNFVKSEDQKRHFTFYTMVHRRCRQSPRRTTGNMEQEATSQPKDITRSKSGAVLRGSLPQGLPRPRTKYSEKNKGPGYIPSPRSDPNQITQEQFDETHARA